MSGIPGGGNRSAGNWNGVGCEFLFSQVEMMMMMVAHCVITLKSDFGPS